MTWGRRISIWMMLLLLTGLLAIPVQAETVSVKTTVHESLGQILTGPNGMTLYVFTRDEAGVSNCYDQCAVNWPPFLVSAGEQVVGVDGISGQLGTTTRADGSVQVTYNGQPLYYWIADKAPGDATGQGVGGVWFVVKAEGAAQVRVAESEQFGPMLTGPNGMTLYVFARDTIGVSNCYNQCAVNWPPLLVPAGEQVVGASGITGQLGTTTRTDGSAQVTYNGMPLYYWVADKAVGDTTGHLVGGVWFVAREGQLLDVAGKWSEAHVSAAMRAGWVTGYPDSTFRPEGQVTRAELVKMLAGAFELGASAHEATFADTSGHWASQVIEAAVAAGVIDPAEYAGGRFEPDRAMTRGEVAAMIVRALGLEAEAASAGSAIDRFADDGEVAAQFRGFLGVAVQKGIVTGYVDNTLHAERQVRRDEAVVMVQRALDSK